MIWMVYLIASWCCLQNVDADAAYRRGDYAAAKSAWEQALAAQGAASRDGRLEYNLGNCEYRLRNYARALWRYERARRSLGDTESVLFNRTLAIRKLGHAEAETSGFAASLSRRVRAWEATDWFWLGFALEVAALLLLALAWRRRALVLSLVAIVLLAGGVFGLWRALQTPADRVLGAVVLDDRTALRAEPRADLPAVLTLAAGVRADFLAQGTDWVQVRVRGRVGWVPRERIGLW